MILKFSSVSFSSDWTFYSYFMTGHYTLYIKKMEKRSYVDFYFSVGTGSSSCTS